MTANLKILKKIFTIPEQFLWLDDFEKGFEFICDKRTFFDVCKY